MQKNINITLNSIIPDIWENTIEDQEIRKICWMTPAYQLLTNQGEILSTPFIKEIDEIVSSIETKIFNRSISSFFEESDIKSLYQHIFFFTQSLSSMTFYLSKYKRQLQKLELFYDYYKDQIKKDLELWLAAFIETQHNLKLSDITNYKTTLWNLDTKSNNEMKFILAELSTKESLYDTRLSIYLWTKWTNYINGKLKENTILNELVRKIYILKSIIEYLNSRYDTLKEEIMTGKKIIDNFTLLNSYTTL